jgi:hypothetical protein
VTRISFSDDSAAPSGAANIVSTRQSIQVVNGQRTVVTTTVAADVSCTPRSNDYLIFMYVCVCV